MAGVSRRVAALLGSVVLSVSGIAAMASPAWAETSQTFAEDGQFTVPDGVTSIKVVAFSAGGGGGGGSGAVGDIDDTVWFGGGGGGGGGGGAQVTCTITVTPGVVLDVEVGVAGTGGAGGENALGGGLSDEGARGDDGDSPTSVGVLDSDDTPVYITSANGARGGGVGDGDHNGEVSPGDGGLGGSAPSDFWKCTGADPVFQNGAAGGGGSRGTERTAGAAGTGGAVGGGTVPASCPANTAQGGAGGLGGDEVTNGAAGTDGGNGCVVLTY